MPHNVPNERRKVPPLGRQPVAGVIVRVFLPQGDDPVAARVRSGQRLQLLFAIFGGFHFDPPFCLSALARTAPKCSRAASRSSLFSSNRPRPHRPRCVFLAIVMPKNERRPAVWNLLKLEVTTRIPSE